MSGKISRDLRDHAQKTRTIPSDLRNEPEEGEREFRFHRGPDAANAISLHRRRTSPQDNMLKTAAGDESSV